MNPVKKSKQIIITRDMVQAAHMAMCCPDGCTYIEDGRKPECDAFIGNDVFDDRVERAIRAALKAMAGVA